MNEDRTAEQLRQAALDLLAWAHTLTPADLPPPPFSFVPGETVTAPGPLLGRLRVDLAAKPGLLLEAAVDRAERLRAYLGAGPGDAPVETGSAPIAAAVLHGPDGRPVDVEPPPFVDPNQTSLFG